MSIKFKYFVTEPFKLKLVEILKLKDLKESTFQSLRRFQKQYNAEVTVFSDRLTEIQKESQAKIDALPEEDKEAKVKELNDEFLKKLEDLSECDSELKPLDYSVIKECKSVIAPIEMDILEPVLTGVPGE